MTVRQLSDLNVSETSSQSDSNQNRNKPRNQFYRKNAHNFGQNSNKHKNVKSTLNNFDSKDLNKPSTSSTTRDFRNSSSGDNNKNQSNIICSNCNMPNHTYQSCKLKRKLFCFNCGLPNVKSGNCSNCSKN